MISMIAAVSKNGIIGADGTIPWQGKYPGDLKRFKELTINGTVIMGSKTWLSMGGRKLPKRNNFVVSSTLPDNANYEKFSSLKDAIDKAKTLHQSIWLIGGQSIYSEGMKYADVIDLTLIPEEIEIKNYKEVATFPWINPHVFMMSGFIPGENGLMHARYLKYR